VCGDWEGPIRGADWHLGLMFAHPLIENRNLATYCVTQCLWDGHLAFHPVPEYGPVAQGRPNCDPDFGKAHTRVLDTQWLPSGYHGKKIKKQYGHFEK